MKNRGFLVTFLPYTFITFCHYFYLGECNKNSWNCNICLHFTYLAKSGMPRHFPGFFYWFLNWHRFYGFYWFSFVVPAQEGTVYQSYLGRSLHQCETCLQQLPNPKSNTILCPHPVMKKVWLLSPAGSEIAQLLLHLITPSWNCLIGQLLFRPLWEGLLLREKWLGWPCVDPL